MTSAELAADRERRSLEIQVAHEAISKFVSGWVAGREQQAEAARGRGDKK